MILDAGSGPRPLTSISDVVVHVDKDPYRIDHFINAVVEALPLRGGVAEKVYGSHVLEHSLEPRKVLLEFWRVSRDEVEIRAPNLCYQNSEQDDHYYTWTADSLRNLMSTVFPEVEIKHNFRIRGGDLIDRVRAQGLIRLLRWVTKFEIIAVGRHG